MKVLRCVFYAVRYLLAGLAMMIIIILSWSGAAFSGAGGYLLWSVARPDDAVVEDKTKAERQGKRFGTCHQ